MSLSTSSLSIIRATRYAAPNHAYMYIHTYINIYYIYLGTHACNYKLFTSATVHLYAYVCTY